MSGNVLQCGHVLNNLLVLNFMMFVTRFVTNVRLCIFVQIVQLDVRCRVPCACSQGYGYLTKFVRGRFPKLPRCGFCLLIHRFAKPSESVPPRLRNVNARRSGVS